MRDQIRIFVPVCLIGFALAAVVAFALFRKGDVKAGMKMPGIEFSIDAKDRQGQH